MRIDKIAVILSVFYLAGCAASMTEIGQYNAQHQREYSLAIGTLSEARFFQNGQKADNKEIRISAAQIRNRLFDALSKAGMFQQVILIPDGNLDQQQSIAVDSGCSYLLTGEITSFGISGKKVNSWFMLSLPLDIVLFPATLGTAIFTGDEAVLFSGLIPHLDITAKVAMNISILEAGTDKIIESRVYVQEHTEKAGSFALMGEPFNKSDNYLDIGRQLGDLVVDKVALDITRELDKNLR